MRWLFTWPCYLALLLVALYVFGLIWLQADAFLANFENIFIMHRVTLVLGMWVVLKAAHEIGHGIVCKRYGGRVPDAGLAFILFAPIAYIDVTSSWRFGSRWQRIHVAAAGVVVELMVATLAGIVWLSTDSAFFRQCASDLIVMATVNSLVFNLNPLMRFDGYFMLTDLLRIDNLYQLGRVYVRYWVRHYLWGIPTKAPTLPTERPRVVKLYGFAAAVWRMVVLFGLIIAAASLFHGAGIVIAMFGVGIWVILPIVALMRDLIRAVFAGEVRITRVFGRMAVASGAVMALLYLVPIEFSRRAPAVVEYSPPTVIRANTEGFVQTVHVKNGDAITCGDPIVTLRNDELMQELSAVSTALSLAQQRKRSAHWNQDSSKIKQSHSAIEGLKKQRQELLRKVSLLTVRSTTRGHVIGRRMTELKGTYLETGDEIATIGLENRKRLKVSVAQTDLRNSMLTPHAEIQVRTAGDVWMGMLSRVEPRATLKPPHRSLCSIGGGRLTVRRNDDGDFQLTVPRVNAFIELDAAKSLQLFTGQRATVTLGPGTRPVAGYIAKQLGW